MEFLRSATIELVWVTVIVLATIDLFGKKVIRAIRESAERSASSLVGSRTALIALLMGAYIMCMLTATCVQALVVMPGVFPSGWWGVLLRVAWMLPNLTLSVWAWFAFDQTLRLLVWREDMRSHCDAE